MTVSLSTEVVCAADPVALWQVVSDTNRVNYVSGHPAVAISPLADGTASRFRVRTRLGPFSLEYDEAPYEWREHERFSMIRMPRGWAVPWYKTEIRLEPLPTGGTRVRFNVEIVPHGVIGRILAHTVGRAILWRASSGVKKEAAKLSRGEPLHGAPSSSVLAGPFQRATKEFRGRISPAQQATAERLLELVRAAPDLLVSRLRPKALAAEWNQAPDEVVPVFLHAVLAGVLDLRWELVCPSCRTGTEGFEQLADLPEQGHCGFCDLVFGVDLDRAVEAVFRPQAAVRAIQLGPWCTGGPARTPHVVFQQILEPGAQAKIQVPSRAGRYRLFGRGGAVAQVEVGPSGAPEAAVRLEAERFEPAVLSLTPGGLLRIDHAAPLHRHVKLEHITWADQALSARELGFHPEFRRSFGRGLLRPGQLLTVSRMCVLFTDLTGSTALYSRLGDAAAFQFVQEHFEYVASIVQRRRGNIIKTIGDAVMAGFDDDAEALAAAVELQRGWADFLAGFPSAADCRLKVGLYGGPCYAVSANGQLDLFGQSVNVAARLQSEAGPGEIVAPVSIVDALAPDGLAPLLTSERFVPELKGVAEAPVVVRLAPTPRQAARAG